MNISRVFKIIDLFDASTEFTVTYEKNDEKITILPENREFIIPNYQREFKWKQKEINTLIDDVLKDSKFLGNVLFNQKGKQLEIIDGQQRISIFYMIIKKLNMIDEDDQVNLCPLINNSFSKFDSQISSLFSEELDPQFDPMHQNVSFKNAWDYICVKLDDTNFDVEEFKTNFLSCDINVLTTKGEDSTKSDKMCLEYFIDINSKNVRLDKIDILKAYIFKENFRLKDKWYKMYELCNEIKSINNDFDYPIENIILHYFLCYTNDKISFKLKKLNDEYKIGKEIKLDSDSKFEEGSDIELVVSNINSFYKDMLNSIIEYLEFIKIILTGPYNSSNFTNYFIKFCKTNEEPDDQVMQCCYDMLLNILCSSDCAPKMLVFKFFKGITEQTKFKKYHKYLSSINALCTMFTTNKTPSKASAPLFPYVLPQDFREKTSKACVLKFDKVLGVTGYSKMFSSPEEAQYLSRRFHTLINSYRINSKMSGEIEEKYLECDLNKYVLYSKTGTGFNDEHFLVNQSGKCTINYKGNDINYEYSLNAKKIIKYISNIIQIDSTINNSMKEKVFFEKFEYLDSVSSTSPHLFRDKLSKKMYELMKEVFIDFPDHNSINACSTVEELKSLLDNYFNTIFLSQYKLYCSRISELKLTDVQ